MQNLSGGTRFKCYPGPFSSVSYTSEYDAVLDAIRDAVEQVTDTQSANSVREALDTMTHIFDSKVRAGMMLNEKCKRLGLKFNKLSKRYEPAA